jgi:hypothetical protein
VTRRRAIVAGCLLVLFCLGVVVTRAVWEGRSALAAGDQALAAGDADEAIARWRRAARWYVPAAPHVGEALDRLEELGAQAAERGDVDLALAAWRGVYGAIKATRSFYTPHGERLEPAMRAISDLMARQEAVMQGAAGAAAPDAEARAAWHYALLARDEAPAVGWTVLALLGFALWIGGGLTFALRGVSAEDRLVPRPAAAAGIMVAVGLLVWMLGLYMA